MKRNNPPSDKIISAGENKKVHDFLLQYFKDNYFIQSKYDSLNDLSNSEGKNENNSFDSLILQAMLAKSDPQRAFNDFKKVIKNHGLLNRVLDINKPLLTTTYDFMNKNNLLGIDSIERFNERPKETQLSSHATLFVAPQKNTSTEDKNIILVVGINTSRYITVLGGIPFYKSSGKNSQEPDTWLPFCGFQENELITEVDKRNIGYLIKPNLDQLTIITDYFPVQLSNYCVENQKSLKNIIFRTGNFAGMCFSMLIGGGFWNKEEGVKLCSFIMANYQDQINQFYEKHKNAIENIKTFNNSAKDDIEQKRGDNTSTQSYQEINTWLKDHGSLAVKSDTWSMNLNFQFKDLNMNNDIIMNNKI